MDKILHVRLDKHDKLLFDRLCFKQSINKSELIRQWIREYIKGSEQIRTR